MVDKIVEKKPDGKMLDIGCALGSFLSFFPESFEKHGSDISEFAINECTKNFPKSKFAESDISAECPFKEKFDLITAFDVLEHTLNLRSALQNISSMLNDDGLIVVGMPVASRMHYLLGFLGRSFLTTQDSHINLPTAKTWKEIILSEHFEVVGELSTTWGKYKVPGFNLFSVFFLKKKK